MSHHDETTDLSLEARALVAAARPHDGPTAGDKARLRTALLAAAGGVTGATVASGAAATGAAGSGTLVQAAGWGAVAAKVATGLAVVGAVAAGGVAISTRTPDAAPASQAASATQAPSGTPIPVVRAPQIPIPTPAASASAPPVALPVAPPPAPKVESDLAAETALLRDAHAALEAGEPARALRLLEEHAANFPRGALVEERLAERVLVLCALGRTFDARVETDRFLRDHGRSPLAARVRASCGADQP